MLRAGRIFERLESYMPIDYSSLELLKFLISTFMVRALGCGEIAKRAGCWRRGAAQRH